ncbi:hypothetical protein KC19_1G175100 [Ceratodon purpureus]|uniref:Uncharacterized protein n=1 Tax=Ceratodon purpureus TaxID=3225 RepID=A0A8T0J946_CERPU|nr:hypothetical protein KC19_1G175100 [Ceratodon purpureus]
MLTPSFDSEDHPSFKVQCLKGVENGSTHTVAGRQSIGSGEGFGYNCDDFSVHFRSVFRLPTGLEKIMPLLQWSKLSCFWRSAQLSTFRRSLFLLSWGSLRGCLLHIRSVVMEA